MSSENYFDIIIGGAGISGLLIASELSKTFRILVIESKDNSELNKFWVTLKSCADINPHLKNFVDSHYTKMEFSDSYKNNFILNGQYILWDSERLINYLKNTIIENNGEINYSQRFCGYNMSKGCINIYANDICFSAKLFIDCMGYNSPLILAKDIIKIKGYYLLYGAKIKLRMPIEPICLSNVMLQKNPSYFEVFPNSKGEAFATMIYPTSSNKDFSNLIDDFEYLVNKSCYSKFFDYSNNTNNFSGVVPVGIIKKKALDRIFFFGESAQSNPASTGTCLTRLLLSYQIITEFIILKTKADNLSEQSLSNSPIILNAFIRKLQIQLYHLILTSNSDKYSILINFFNQISDELINKFIFGELTVHDILKRKYLFLPFKKGNSLLIKPFISSLLNLPDQFF